MSLIKLRSEPLKNARQQEILYEWDIIKKERFMHDAEWEQKANS